MKSTRVKKIEEALRKPMTCKQLAAAVYLSERAVEKHMTRMHSQGQVHIAGWNRTGGSMERIFLLGIGVDAPRPQRYTRRELNARWLARESQDSKEIRMARTRAVKRKIKVHPLMAAFYGVKV